MSVDSSEAGCSSPYRGPCTLRLLRFDPEVLRRGDSRNLEMSEVAVLPSPLPRPEPERQRNTLLISGRRNVQSNVDYISQVEKLLCDRSVPVKMVRPDSHFGSEAVHFLYTAKALLAFCSWDYGEDTRAGFDTYIELKHAYENQLAILPIQICRQ
eukprot:s481_g10.t1